MLLTGVMNVAGSGTGVEARMGLFDDDDGLFIELADTTASVAIRDGGVDTKTARSAWNYDSFDGEGPSGVDIDWSKTQIFFIDYEWLGVGRVRYGFVVDGIPYLAHAANHANVETTTYMGTPNLPVRYQVITTDAAADLIQVCSSVVSEGGLDGFGYVGSATTPVAGYAANTADLQYAVLGIRLKDGALDAMVKPLGASFLMESATDADFFWARNPTIANTFTCADVDNSAVQLCTGTGGGSPSTVTDGSWDTKFGGGHVQASGQGASASGRGSAASVSNLYLGSTIDGVQDTLVLVLRTYDATATAHAHISWEELR